MPGFNRRGPRGEGPRTGRGQGPCGQAARSSSKTDGAAETPQEPEPVERPLPFGFGGGQGRGRCGGGRGQGRGQGRGRGAGRGLGFWRAAPPAADPRDNQ